MAEYGMWGLLIAGAGLLGWDWLEPYLIKARDWFASREDVSPVETTEYSRVDALLSVERMRNWSKDAGLPKVTKEVNDVARELFSDEEIAPLSRQAETERTDA